MKESKVFFTLLSLYIFFLFFWISSCKPTSDRPLVILKTATGVETTEFQFHESVFLDVIELEPATEYKVTIQREDDRTVSELNLTSDHLGRITETVVWYDIGELPYTNEKEAVVKLNVADYDICDFTYLGKTYTLHIIRGKDVVHEKTFRVIEDKVRPTLFAADSRGVHKSGFLIGKEDVYVVGKNFPTDCTVRLWAVEAKAEWNSGDKLIDVTGQYAGKQPPVFEIKLGKNGFKKLLWPKTLGHIGSYDIVTEIITYPCSKYSATAKANVERLISYNTISGFIIQRPPEEGEPLEMNLAGASNSPLTYRETFLTNENVYVGVDPTVQPSFIGQTADVYIVNDKTEAQWQQPHNLSNEDVTGTATSITIQAVCGNCWKTLAWPAPLTVGEYDVVFDFNQNNKYDAGIDLIDALDDVGFTVSEVRVDKISFNFTGSNAVTILESLPNTKIMAPEYSEDSMQKTKPAAWVKSGSYSVKVDFVATSNFNSVQIWAEDGLGGLNSVNVNFSNNKANATMSVNSVPTQVGKNTFDWRWKYKTTGADQKMGYTRDHIVYSVFSNPVAASPSLSADPLLKVLDYSCTWGSGATTKEGVIVNMLNEGFAKHYNWVGNCHWLASTFDRLVSAQGIDVVQHKWSKKYPPYSLNDISIQKTKNIDPVGPYAGLGPQSWNFHQWAQAEGKQRDPSVAISFNGTWINYEDDVYIEYYTATSITPSLIFQWLANQTGTESGGWYIYPAPFEPWKDPDF